MPVLYALFDTAIGVCGLAWGAHGILGAQLPETSAQKTRARLLQCFPGAGDKAAAGEAERAAEGIAALLRGEPSDLSGILLDMSTLPPFHRRVYAAARAIPRGSTVTYGALADSIGAPRAARAVGQALARNPFPLLVPCHRVTGANGRMGGFSAHGGIATKLRLLAIEGLDRPWEARSSPWLLREPVLRLPA
ncbi:MAG: methylated-DNA--[protein]-cysteine S-methyltransferase [Methylocapsa sp.]|nr:methylated-DNA--[protein]-cysteine S-methyltransferase [Methylocapsa sp.]